MAKESSKNVGASIPEEDRGRDESRHEGASKNRGKSKDLLSSLEKRLANVETFVAESKAQVEEINQHVDGLDSDFVDMRDDFKSALNVLSAPCETSFMT